LAISDELYSFARGYFRNLIVARFEGCFILSDINEEFGLEFENINFNWFNGIVARFMGFKFFINLIVCFLIIGSFIENHDGYFLVNFQDCFGLVNQYFHFNSFF
jgi:hypothetical protein